jgi:hypothetical protein
MPARKRKASTGTDVNPANSRRPHRPHEQPPNPVSLSLVQILDPTRYYPIYDRLCSCMPLRDTLALSRTCTQMRHAYRERWSVDRRLTRFVKDPKRLRSELGRFASLISGSFALQFFAQCLWPDSDLDIFVERGVASDSFDTYLQNEEHYGLHSTKDQDTYAMRDLVQVTLMSRQRSRPERADGT